MKGNKIIRRKIFTGPDFYETPRVAIDALLDNEEFEGNILEPACGGGAISIALKDRGYTVRSQDIQEDCGYGKNNVDFLKYNHKADNIITNPPYKLAEQFIWHGLEIVKHKLALLLRLTFLESAKRYTLFLNTPISTIYVFSKRITMYPAGQPKPKNNGTAAYMWIVWDKDINPMECPTIDWLMW